MSADHVFYKRFNFQSVAMEEYEVRDVSRRADAPDLQLRIQTQLGEPAPISFRSGQAYSDKISIVAYLVNQAPTVAEHVLVNMLVVPRLSVSGADPHFRVVSERTVEINEARFTVTQFQLNWGPQYKMPVWQGVKLMLTDTPMRIRIQRDVNQYLWGWELHSPGMVYKSGAYVLRSEGNALSVAEVYVDLPDLHV